MNIVSAEAEIWSGAAQMVVAKTSDGEIGILAGHEPILAILGAGEARVKLADGSVIKVNAEDGFLSVEQNVVSIVAGSAAIVQ